MCEDAVTLTARYIFFVCKGFMHICTRYSRYSLLLLKIILCICNHRYLLNILVTIEGLSR